MIRTRKKTHYAAILAVLGCAANALAQYDLSWHTIDGGGGFSSGGAFEFAGTIGRPDPGVLSGGIFTVSGGFWAGSAIANPCALPGDLDSDRDVDIVDLATLLGNFGAQNGATPAMGDSDADGDVDLTDLSALLSHFGAIC